jgi:hypothetical protein
MIRQPTTGRKTRGHHTGIIRQQQFHTHKKTVSLQLLAGVLLMDIINKEREACCC